MDDSGLRERVAAVFGNIINTSELETEVQRLEWADAILALVDAEYRPLLVQANAGRDSLAQEIAGCLKSRGKWVPLDYKTTPSDLIGAVGKALDENNPLLEQAREALLLMRQFGHAQNGERCELCEKVNTAIAALDAKLGGLHD